MFAVTASAAAPHRSGRQSAPTPVFYDISDDPRALKLLALSDSGRSGTYTLIDVIDVQRLPKLMATSTWRIDCAAERMAVVHTVHVQPGSPMGQEDVAPAPISTRSTPSSFRVAQLACTGQGQLVERRTYRAELIDIVKRFWAQ